MAPRNNNLKTKLKESGSEDIDQLFVYGTLQSGQSRNHILRGLSFEKALLSEHRKEVPPELGFPFIVQDKRSHVEGEVYFGLKQSHWLQIDLIEGETVKLDIGGVKTLERTVQSGYKAKITIMYQEIKL